MKPTLLCSGPELGPVPRPIPTSTGPTQMRQGDCRGKRLTQMDLSEIRLYVTVFTPNLAACPVLNWFRISPVAVRASLRRGLIKENLFPLNLFLQGMAHRAGHVLVGPCQRELGALVVVEGRRRPVLVDV